MEEKKELEMEKSKIVYVSNIEEQIKTKTYRKMCLTLVFIILAFIFFNFLVIYLSHLF